jgi:hypothetical protein
MTTITHPTAGDDRTSGGAGPTIAAFDAALSRLSPLEWPAPIPYANHGPMAIEALVALHQADALDAWVEATEAELVLPVPDPPTIWDPADRWPDALGDGAALPAWRAALSRDVEIDGWESTVETWVPRLAPFVASGLFHGVIRTAHAVRSLERATTPAREGELVQALAHWAVWARPGRDPASTDGNPAEEALAAAGRAAAAFVAAPDIVSLHRVTGAMAVQLLAARLATSTGVALVAQLEGDTSPYLPGRPEGPDEEWDPAVVGAARASLDPHQVKLVEACARGHAGSGSGVFVEAARVVTGLVPDEGVW